MKLLIILFVFVIASQAQETSYRRLHEPTDAAWTSSNQEKLNPKIQKTIRDRRIAGGTEVIPHSHPYKVALHTITELGDIGFNCGASVLSTTAVLTAAHCIDDASFTIVIAGAHNQQIVEPSQQRRLVGRADYRIYENWSPFIRGNDIAILIIAMPFTYNNFVQPTRLPTEFINESFAGETGRSLGWGRTEHARASPVLNEVYNRILSNEECRGNANYVCVELINRGVCSGDSGGALTVDRPGDPRPIQIGVAANVADGWVCSLNSTGTARFTRITSYLTWIEANQF